MKLWKCVTVVGKRSLFHLVWLKTQSLDGVPVLNIWANILINFTRKDTINYGFIESHLQIGPIPLSDLRTTHKTLNSILAWMGSQWTSLSNGVTWSNFFRRHSSLAAIFLTSLKRASLIWKTVKNSVIRIFKWWKKLS
jgi:hypothetical protein